MKLFLTIFIIFSQLVFAKSLYLSELPLPSVQIINLNTNECNTQCLNNLLSNGQIFSFLSKYNIISSDKNLTEKYHILTTLLNIKDNQSINQVSIALLFPKKIIGRYAISTSNSVLAYLLKQNISFKLELFDCHNETFPMIEKAVQNIQEQGYSFVIAPLTSKGVEELAKINTPLIFYIPTVNKNDFSFHRPNFIFGGISYKKQIEKLLPLTNDKIAIFSDESSIGYKLSRFVKDSDKSIVYQKVIPQSETRFRSFLKYNRRLENSSIFLNTPLIKSSLLSSQFRFYKIKPYAIFSTQINYNPLLLNLTQYDDRKDMFIANSIGTSNPDLVVINKLLGNDIRFDWINYSTSIGIDYLYSLYFDSNSQRLFDENIIDNQVQYKINIVKPTMSSFEEIDNF